ncbi:proton-conducting transporter membrane subunit [Rubinisphaera sp. JC750]|uniref:proton-conducting transporter transmembrane domain-containing protein n=1 Tax=Rubinisphaera sp. JC750 TaxID=2898658 RepID=UPI001F329768|nr:proton-conducting transporter membrane subunit [Rubinisphaera sp. JC750]
MGVPFWFHFLGLVVVASPAMLVALLGLKTLLGLRFFESTQAALTRSAVVIGLLASLAVLAMMLIFGTRHVPVEVGNWVLIEETGLHFFFHLKFVFDRLSVPFTILSFVLCGVVGAFASSYLHRDDGYSRFFLLYAVFLLGMVVSSLAGTIETLFFGWELVGLSSALLVAYFHTRPGPVRNGLRIWTIYRFSDAAFLLAALMLHHLAGAGEFDRLMGSGAWPEGTATVAGSSVFWVGLLLLIAAAGKSGMVPFSGWLPRAMEGPTPSSAVFYGALSIHLGTYLLLRVSPLLDVSPTLRICVLAMGFISAVYGAIVSRVQTDVKNALAFASLTQVGIITMEIGAGLYYIALIHMIGHATLRTLQLLRAPSVLKDRQMLENAIGGRLPAPDSEITEPRWRRSLYRFAHERGFLDAMLDEYIVRPFVQIFRFFDSCERRWTSWLSGAPVEQPDPSPAETPAPCNDIQEVT